MRRLMVCLSLVALTGCGDPIISIAGGELSGEVQPAPEVWAGIPDVVQVEFRPGKDPYSVNIWAVGIGADLYIATGAEGNNWTAMLADDPAVRFRAGDTLYELLATPVSDVGERARVLEAYVAKYDIDPAETPLEDGLVFRLDR